MYDSQQVLVAPSAPPVVPPGGQQPPDPPSPDARRPRRRHWSRMTASAIALVLLGGVGGIAITQTFLRPTPAQSVTSTGLPGGQTLPRGDLLPGGPSGPVGAGGTGDGTNAGASVGPPNAAAIAERVDPAVVNIDTTLGYRNAQAAGTGMVLTSDGEVLTNNHVIAGATSISVTDVGNGKSYSATVVGYDRADDVAVLQLKGASRLRTISASSTSAKLGDQVVGVGNAGGSGGTPSYAGGVITAVDQTITASDASDGTSEQLTGLLETNANIVAGDSGGPLVDTQGRVVGMDTAGSVSYRFSSSAQAFAIPIQQALQIAGSIERGQSSATIHIGPTAMLGVSVDSSPGSSGVSIGDVISAGPAEQAGLSAGDTITSVNGRAVMSPDDLSSVMLSEKPGATVQLGYADRAGEQHAVTVRLAAGPPQ